MSVSALTPPVTERKKGANRCSQCGDFIRPSIGCPRCTQLANANRRIEALTLRLIAERNEYGQSREVLAETLRNTVRELEAAKESRSAHILISAGLFAAALLGWTLYFLARG